MHTKRSIYIFLFVVLGVLTSFLLHAAIEIYTIQLLLSDFQTFGLGLAWRTWVFIHHASALVLFVAGVFFGFRHGIYWWGVIYEKNQLTALHR